MPLNTEKEMRSFFDSAAPEWDKNERIGKERIRKLVSSLGIREGDRVLDIACGTGVITGILHDLTETDVLGIDLSDRMIDLAKEKYKGISGVSFIEGDFLTYPFESSSYDFAVIYNAYPHFLEPECLSGKLSSVLKEGGKFAVLHSLSRKELSVCHERMGHLSRELMPPLEEAKYFEKEFEILQADEDEHSYRLVMRKK